MVYCTRYTYYTVLNKINSRWTSTGNCCAFSEQHSLQLNCG